jgi:hypothetical protein
MLKKTKISGKGFAALEVFLVAVLITAVVAIGALVYRGRDNLQANNQQAEMSDLTVQ